MHVDLENGCSLILEYAWLYEMGGTAPTGMRHRNVICRSSYDVTPFPCYLNCCPVSASRGGSLRKPSIKGFIHTVIRYIISLLASAPGSGRSCDVTCCSSVLRGTHLVSVIVIETCNNPWGSLYMRKIHHGRIALLKTNTRCTAPYMTLASPRPGRASKP